MFQHGNNDHISIPTCSLKTTLLTDHELFQAALPPAYSQQCQVPPRHPAKHIIISTVLIKNDAIIYVWISTIPRIPGISACDKSAVSVQYMKNVTNKKMRMSYYRIALGTILFYMHFQ